MINSINVPEILYNLFTDDLQYNLKLVSNYFNIDSNQIIYDIDEIFDLCVESIQNLSKNSYIVDIQDFQSMLNFNNSNSLIDIMFLRQGLYDIDDILTEYNIIRQTNCLLLKEPYTFFCILKDNQLFRDISSPNCRILVR